jgi:hypothetical protein
MDEGVSQSGSDFSPVLIRSGLVFVWYRNRKSNRYYPGSCTPGLPAILVRRPNLSFRWMEDELPPLQKISRLGISFDLILLTSIDEVGDHEGWRIHCCPSPVCRLNSVTWNVVGEVIGDYRDHILHDDVRRPDHQAVNSLGSSRSSSNEVIRSSGLLRRISAPSSSAIE